MKKDKLKPGQIVKISKGRKSGLAGRDGAGVGVYDDQAKVQSTLENNAKTLKILNNNDSLEELKSDPLPPGWIEFYI
ncbi:MAG: hypothetical protein K6T94_07525 [Paenibacillus sp.]|nr:hypothetical protein [Paenibacillus sp.]